MRAADGRQKRTVRAVSGVSRLPGMQNTKPLVERMPGRCPKCGSGILKRKSKKGYVFYACERGAECGFMTWDVPTANDCPSCGQTLFKKSGKGRMKPFCINEACPEFVPEDKRGYRRRMPKATTETVDTAEAVEETPCRGSAEDRCEENRRQKDDGQENRRKKVRSEEAGQNRKGARRHERPGREGDRSGACRMRGGMAVSRARLLRRTL